MEWGIVLLLLIAGILLTGIGSLSFGILPGVILIITTCIVCILLVLPDVVRQLRRVGH